ncbi:hypothetical protein FHG87_021925 [Trinorchestia longiramus]|nr:hypothetical protein FHG87_021925 [Trinorchestia longiramus]
MEKLMQLLRLSSDFAKNRGSMVPWEVPRAAPATEGVVPGAVVESLRAGVYEAVDSSSSMEYRCTACGVVVGNTAAADEHAYIWQHCECLASKGGLSCVVADRLLGRTPLEGALPLARDFKNSSDASSFSPSSVLQLEVEARRGVSMSVVEVWLKPSIQRSSCWTCSSCHWSGTNRP